MKQQIINESELHAHADGQFEPNRRAEIENWLESHPADAEKVAEYQRQNDVLHALFDPVLTEPVPARLRQPERKSWFTLPLMRYAAVMAWVALGVTLGWFMHGSQETRPSTDMAFVRQAAIAHAVYTPEVRHPVEVGADQEDHLVAWLSKRLDTQLKVPHLGETGYQLVGGSLLPGSNGPAAQFMYQDSRGQRLTLYVRSNASKNKETAFRYARANNISVFYWMDGAFGYALSGDIEKPDLLRVAQVVYRQLNP
jgi:anti-sigma factor RsiW